MTTKQKSDRPKYEPRKIIMRGAEQVERAMALLRNVPLDPLRPLEFLLREEVKPRKLDQNGLMWAGPLADIAAQAWLDGRQFSAEVWHHWLKVELLPEEYDPELCLEGYRKWEFDPDGNRILVGSTKMLTVRGMSEHLDAIFAFGATLGVQFRVVGKEAL